ncbi:MAG: nickel pincer cofactor biosynthesis protein LarB [Thermotogae bacterium]|nr:nickel pincer cofactor biosynthesis protein LarB [Thermotogota bacterium]
MNDLKEILLRVKNNEISVNEAEKLIKNLKDPGYEDLGYAKVDHHREKRRGFPEVVFCQGKTPEQVVEIVKTLLKHHKNILATRADDKIFKKVSDKFKDARYNKIAKTIIIEREPLPKVGKILIVSAGTSDLPVVEEVKESASLMGNNVEVLVDVGVAGIHRLFGNLDKLESARVIVVVAGMDGALPSVVAGLVDKPVIAVPTSVGYGANLNGLAPLLTMLNNCSGGIGVVNIDNGFGAAHLASLINRLESIEK